MSSINSRKFNRRATKQLLPGSAGVSNPITHAIQSLCYIPNPQPPTASPCSSSIGLARQLLAGTALAQETRSESDQPVAVSQVIDEPLRWIFPGWIPAGKISVLFGEPGVGKSQISLDIAARLSCGREMPNPPGHEAPSKHRVPSPARSMSDEGRRATPKTKHPESCVLLFSSEDSISNTIKPRLMAAGADCDRIRVFPSGGHGVLADPIALTAQIVAHNASLVIVDPLTAYAGSHDIYRDQHMRRMLAPLAMVAEKTGAAILLIHHVNKSGRGSALMRSAGSIGITATARSVMMVGKDPADPSKRVLAHVKGNLGQPPPSLRFHFVQDEGSEQPHIEWDGVTENTTADSLLQSRPQTPSSQMLAENFLRDVLSAGPRPSKEVEDLAAAHGIASRTLDRAKQAVTRSVKVGAPGMAQSWQTELKS